ncbi:uncharacterized protein LOC115436762 [Sphaeramia orbicularis]|uniref:uncharacterized protein LOC115436762 n=1 Tax=Sphaeramia orbicularis TaxID=375764 RepID=UPI00117E17E5|nr:uncharacterized protein LOC115436762 [Sphaeramia orbicularis]
MPVHEPQQRAGAHELRSCLISDFEADSLESVMYSFSIKVEYCRSFEYSLKLKSLMSPTSFSKRPKTSRKKQQCPSSDEDVIKRRVWSKRQRVGRKQSQAEDKVCSIDIVSNSDIIDIINRQEDTKHVAEDNGEILVELCDVRVDDSDEEKGSVTSSVASGPSVPFTYSPMKLRTHVLCSACCKLYQKARKMKAPLKDKLLDNDPTSLTCDQWILMKTWKSQRVCNTRGKLLVHIQLIKKRLKVNSSVRKSEWLSGEAVSCSRPHTFLQRNLRRCIKVLVKRGRKKNRRKRRRNDSQGSRIIKQQRLRSNKQQQHISVICTGDDSPQPVYNHSDSPVIGRRSSPESGDSEDADLSFEVVPTSISMETTAQEDAQNERIPKQKAPKGAGRFRDLLAQLHGNNNMVVKEMS